jgi:hypothetical protein
LKLYDINNYLILVGLIELKAENKEKLDYLSPNIIYQNFYDDEFESLEEQLQKKVHFENITDVD